MSLAQTLDFTEEQTAAGRQAYREHCASCHGANLEGADVAPGLVGSRFDYTWRGKSVETLAFHVRRMPPESVAESGSLSEEMYGDILAYILRMNDFEPGDVALPSDEKALREVIIPNAPGMGIDLFVPVRKSERQIALLENLPTVTDELLLNPSPEDWVHWGGGYDMHNFSRLTEIDKGNVSELKPAWRAPLREGRNNPAPLVLGAVMFVYAVPDTLVALDATNGDVLWRYAHVSDARVNNHMGVALHGDRVYIPTSDMHVVALDAKSGEVVWDHTIPRENPGFELRSAPLVVNDVVIQPVMGIYTPKGGFVVGLDINTGEEIWRFNVIPRLGEAGDHTWNDIPLEKRSGGSMWCQGSYDPELNLVYFGTAPTYDTKPLVRPIDKEGVTNEALYTNCTLALNPDTGELVWYFQHLVNDQWDHDWAFERQIMELPIEGEMRKVVMTIGKLGILDALDAATGDFLFSMDMGVQNVVKSIDLETGDKTLYDYAKVPDPTKEVFIATSNDGARCWPSLSYNPDTKRLYVPLSKGGFLVGTEGYQLVSADVKMDWQPFPDSDGKMGHVQAVDLGGQTFDWRHEQSPPVISSMLATAGGVVFGGDVNRNFMAFDDSTGEILWSTELDDVPSSNIVSYAVDGKQYVSVVVGHTNYHVNGWSRVYHKFAEELEMPVNDGPKGGAAIWVFSL
ncbi:MAG: PQQ-binding-like beta-propeller repeat protein [Candidatus Hydrogenedentota bacterium]